MENYLDMGFERFARGSLVHLHRYDQRLFKKVLRVTDKVLRRAAPNIHLHAFGMNSINILSDLFVGNSYNSLDTSAVLNYTNKLLFMTPQGQFTPFTGDHGCSCQGCTFMREHYFTSIESYSFLVNQGEFPNAVVARLFTHNCWQLNLLAEVLMDRSVSVSTTHKLGSN